MQTINNKILSRIFGHGRGWVFLPSDFIDEFNRKQIDNALSDLVKKDRIRRIYRGLYDYPRYNELLDKQLGPDIDLVARALARKFNWRIQPSGETALNVLGLSTQVPGRYIYLSDGPNRSYKIERSVLEFKKVVLKEVGLKHRESQLITQALKALGQTQINDEILDQIRQQVDDKKRSIILKDTRKVTGWVYDYIKRICTDDN